MGSKTATSVAVFYGRSSRTEVSRTRSEVAYDGVGFAAPSDWRVAERGRRWTRHQRDERPNHATGSTTPAASRRSAGASRCPDPSPPSVAPRRPAAAIARCRAKAEPGIVAIAATRVGATSRCDGGSGGAEGRCVRSASLSRGGTARRHVHIGRPHGRCSRVCPMAGGGRYDICRAFPAGESGRDGLAGASQE